MHGAGYEDPGFARVDVDRAARTGVPVCTLQAAVDAVGVEPVLRAATAAAYEDGSR